MVRDILSASTTEQSNLSLPMPTSEYKQSESPSLVEISADTSARTIDEDVDDAALWLEVGTHDHTYTSYEYLRDGSNIFDNPQREPLGLYNDLHHFTLPIVVEENISVRVSRDSDASGPEEYGTKIRYVPIAESVANQLSTALGSL